MKFKKILKKSAPFLGRIGYYYLRFVFLSGRWHIHKDPETERLLTQKHPIIPVFWHNRLLMIPFCKPKDNKFYMLVSRNIIGDIAQSMMRFFNIHFIRGSAHNPKKPDRNKGGQKAFREILTYLEQGHSVAFTPDGPKGPAYSVKKGCVVAASLTGVPIVAVTYNCKRKYIFKSWDKFILPLPFSRGTLSYGAPIYLKENLNDADIEKACQHVKEALFKMDNND